MSGVTPDLQTWATRSPEETQDLGAALAERLEPGDLLALRGDLGSGKTCLIQGICRGLRIDDYVTSPTFILINEYVGRVRGRPVPVYHFDLYRIGAPEELEDLGAEEYFYGRGICLIEWAERAGDLLPPRRLDLTLEYLTASERRIALRAS
jgi:tRNA threonylcarbamoyladenosine biosynthesis protein TsaE